MTKLKFSLLDVKLASRKQKRNEKRKHGECRLLNSPLFFFFFFVPHSKPRHHAWSWNVEIKKNDFGIL
jgi:hypothetical protein